jgi:hypothetical protein
VRRCPEVPRSLRSRVLAAATVALLVLLGGGASMAGSAAATTPHQSFLWGAWIGSQLTGREAPWDWNAVTAFEQRNAGGRHLNAVHWGIGTPWDHEFNYWLGPLNSVRNAGAVSVVDMDTGSVSLRKVTKGAYDGAFRRWANEAASWGYPLLLRFDFEMNGQWFPWGTRPINQNTPADFVAAWRHVHNIFTAAGATNVGWVWCPNIDPLREMTSVNRLYPGGAYVDWTCLDGYNFGKSWMSFSKLYTSSYRRIVRLAPSKPMLIGEVATTGRGGNKARWIHNMFRALPSFRHIHGLLWWDKWARKDNRRLDWPIETSKAASTAFRRGISSTLARTCRGLTGNTRAQCMGEAAGP